MGGKSSTVQSQNSPNPAFLAAYQKLLGQAQGVAGTPYQPNPYVTAAPLAQGQQQAIQQGTSGEPWQAAMPYITGAVGQLGVANQYLGNSQAPIWPQVQQFSPSAVNQYANPYTQRVVKATEQQLQNVNRQQMTQLAGNAASQGALGGSRAGAAEAILGGQQAAQEAPTIAGLYSQGYGQALQEFNTQQQAQLGATEAQNWLASQGAFGAGQVASQFGALGNQALNTDITGINTELGVGGLQQQQQQAEANIPAYNFYAQQAYPFQTTNFLAGITEGTGSLAGGTGSTTYPPPSVGSQLLGAGVAGTGILGATGAFGNNGWLGNLFGGSPAFGMTADQSLAGINAAGAAVRRGGVIHRAPGGGIISGMAGNQPASTMQPMISGAPMDGSSIPTGLSLYVPQQASASGGKSPFVQQLINPGSSSTTSGGSGILGGLTGLASIGNIGAQAAGFSGLGSALGALFALRRGGGILVPRHMQPRGYAGGGDVFDQPLDINTGVPDFVPADDAVIDVGHGAPPVVPPMGMAGGLYGAAMLPGANPIYGGTGIAGGPSGPAVALPASAFSSADLVPTHDDYSSPRSAASPGVGTGSEPTFGYGASPASPAGLQAPSGGGAGAPAAAVRAGDLLSGATLPAQAPSASPSGAGIIPASYTPPQGSSNGVGGEGIAQPRGRGDGASWGLPLLAAGLGIMAGRSPYAAQNIGAGGLEGIKVYQEMPRMREEQARAEMSEAQLENMRRFQASMGIGSGSGITGASGSPPGGGIISGASSPVISRASGQPMFDLAGAYRQAQSLMASGYAPAEAMGKSQMSLIEGMMKDGVTFAPNGGLMPISGAAEAKARQVALNAQAEFPFKASEELLSRAGTPIQIEGNRVGTTGYQLLPPQFQRLIGAMMGGAGGQDGSAPTSDPFTRFASAVPQVENATGNPAAKNPLSSATGNGQFIDSTWLSLFKGQHPDIASTMSDQQILSLRANPQISQAMTADYARQNAPVIASAGFPVNGASLWLAHGFGPAGAVKILNAPADAPAGSLFGPDVMRANPYLQGQTAGSIVQRAVSKFGTEPMQLGGGSATPATPAPEVSRVGGDLPNLPPTSNNFGETRLVPLPGGGYTATNNKFVQEAQTKLAAHIGDLPAETEKLRNSQSNLVSLMDELKTNAEGPSYLQSGMGAEFRTGFARAINTTATTLGLTPPLPQEAVAANETIKKGAVNASFSLARSMVGARVAVAEVQYAFKANPNLENTPFGNILMSNMLIQENQRQIDRNDYVFEQASRNADPMLAERTFDQVRPPVNYLRTAKADAIQYYFPALAKGLSAAPTVANIEAVNKKFGPGTAEAILHPPAQ